MNAHFAMPLQSDCDAFHLRRSRCLDAFSDLEEQLAVLQSLLNIKLSADSLGQKLEALKAAKASPKFSRERLTKLKELLPICEALNGLRNDIVHSRMQIAMIGKDQLACFANVRQPCPGSQTARLFTIGGLDELHRSVRQAAAKLKQLSLNPASSPPPPSPGATGVP